MITPEETALVHSAITWSAGLGEPVAKEERIGSTPARGRASCPPGRSRKN